MSLAQALIRDVQSESTMTRAILEAGPEEKLDWKPHERSMSVGQLAGHLAEAPSWHSSMGQDVFDFAAELKDYRPFVPANRAELLAAYDKNVGDFLAFLEGKDDDFMNATWRGVAGEEEKMAGPREVMMRSILLRHVSHHRGQLTVYLRMLNVPVPTTYGPTADFPG